MNKKLPLISVIIPIYKVEKFLDHCIQSILNQTYQNLEIILVDDGSPDGCGAICDSYASKDDRIKVIHKENGGLSSARNAGIDICHGDFIYCLDSDDYIAPAMLEILYESMTKADTQLAFCNIQYVDANGTSLTSKDSYREYDLPDAVWTPEDFWHYYEHIGKIPCVITSNKLFRRELFSTLRYPIGKLHEDEFVIHYLIADCQKICCVSDRLYFYRQHSTSIMSNRYSIKHLDVVEAFIDRINFFVKRSQPSHAAFCMVDLIAYLNWYNYGVDKNDTEAVSRYKALDKKSRKLAKEVLPIADSITSKAVIFLYITHLLPYRFIRFCIKTLEKIK